MERGWQMAQMAVKEINPISAEDSAGSATATFKRVFFLCLL
jgi:hypothetical protein